jgi:cobalt/nickel transport system ATP-binding protein
MAGSLEKTIASVARVIEATIASERWAHAGGRLQSIDARVKIAALPLFILLCALTKSLPMLVVLYIVSLILAVVSGIRLVDFIKRVWIFIPIFTGVIAIPALFLTPGRTIAAIGSLEITREGLTAAAFLVMRVSTSVSFAMLLILTTRWDVITRALGDCKVPATLVALLSISYRYFILLLRTLLELLTARTSRVISRLPYRLEYNFLSRSAGMLFVRSLHLAGGVQMAMESRGSIYGSAGGLEENKSTTSSGYTGPAGERTDTNHIFSLRNVSYSYPDGTLGVQVDELHVHAGACTIILGPNGSGKSTLLKILDGLFFPQNGEVRAFGETITEDRLNEKRFRRFFRSRIGLVFQNPDVQNFSPTVRDELAFGPMQKGLHGEELDCAVDRAMEILGIGTLGDRYPYRLSGGEKKRVAIASVLTVDPEVYLLDEPTASLDPATEGILIDLLADLTDQRKTLVIATQDLLLARHIGEWAVVLDQDRAVAASGTIAEVLARHDLLESTGLVHAHRAPHRTAAAGFRHSHYTEKNGNG